MSKTKAEKLEAQVERLKDILEGKNDDLEYKDNRIGYWKGQAESSQVSKDMYDKIRAEFENMKNERDIAQGDLMRHKDRMIDFWMRKQYHEDTGCPMVDVISIEGDDTCFDPNIRRR